MTANILMVRKEYNHYLAGIYGMNFENIPELVWKNGYLYFWILIIFVGVGLLIYFRRKKWL